MKKQKLTVSRRKFLLSAATAAITPSILLQSFAATKPDRKLNHACIGVGGMGMHDLQNFKSHPKVQIVAICDVDENNLKKAAAILPDARTYTDWRELLKKEKNNIDSVNVTVPDHNHFIIAYNAIRIGKNVYCQKPLCHDVEEIRALTIAAVNAGVVTQLGTQVAATVGDRTGVQWIKEGIIGKVKHAYLCSNRPGATEAYRLVGPRPIDGQAPPANLNWEIWVGTAPMRPYVPAIYHQTKWRAWQDFGTGWSGDIGCHIFDPVCKGLGLKAPRTVVAEVQKSWENSPERRADTWPQANHITWKFPGNELTASDELTLEWFDGEFYPPEEVRALYSVEKYPAESSMLIGTEGALLIPHQGTPVLLPESKFKDHLQALLRFEPWAESVWKDYPRIPNSGYFGDGASTGNGGIRGTCGIALSYAVLVHEFPDVAERQHRLKRVEAALRYAEETHQGGIDTEVGVDGKKWGVVAASSLKDPRGWQSSLWTASMGFAAALVEKKIDPKVVVGCKQVVADEADWLSKKPPPSGYQFDTKAEENAWQSNIVTLAAAWMPEDPRAKKWIETAKLYLVNTYTVPTDSSGPLKEWIKTQTLFSSYALENHGFYHPTYQMVAGMSMGDSYLMARMIKQKGFTPMVTAL